MIHVKSNQLSSLVKAQLTIMSKGHYCVICRREIKQNSLGLIGASIKPDGVYMGGHFHTKCWLSINSHPYNERTIKMSEEKINKVKVPEAQPIDQVVDLSAPWDYTHSEVKNQYLIITSVTPIETQYGEGLLAECFIGDEQARVLIGGTVLVQQLQKAKGHFPISAMIVKEGRYYTFK